MAVKKNLTLMLKKLKKQVTQLQKKEESARNKLRAALRQMVKRAEAKDKAVSAAVVKFEKHYAKSSSLKKAPRKRRVKK